MLELKGITFKPPASGDEPQRTIIKDLDFTFEKGKFYAITGPNGSGKTTLAKIIMGINRHTEGSVWLDGKDISRLSISERAKAGIAYAFQHSARFKGMTFRDLL